MGDVTLRVRTILLVDDFETQLRAWEREFRDEPIRVLKATNRRDAVRCAHRERPEVAIVDLYLGSESGIDVVTDLKRANPNLFCVLVSSHMTVAHAMAGVRAGANDCYIKPLRVQHVRRRIEQSVPFVPDDETVPSLDVVEWEHITRVLHDFDGNITRAASALKLHRQSLQRKIGRHAPRALRTRG